MDTGQSGVGGDVSAESWKVARAAAEKLGYIPASFSIAIRSLLSDHMGFGKKFRPVTKYQVARLLKTPTFKSMLYYSSKELREEYVQETDHITVGGMLDLYEPYDVAALIACFVYYRKVRSLLGDEHWDDFKPAFSKDSQLGGHLGVAVPGIGIAQALLVGSIRYIGLASLILSDPKKYRTYANILRKEEKHYDFDKELELFGASSQQIGVFTLSKMGFGVDVGEAFSVAFDDSRGVDSLKGEPLPYQMRLGRLWIEALKEGADQPTTRIPGEYYPLQKAREVLDRKVSAILNGKAHWLECTKDDISPEKTPKLFKELNVSEEIPEELATVFSMDEITAMEEEDFDDLIDQMDAEQDGKVPAGSVVLKEKDIQDLEDMVSE